MATYKELLDQLSGEIGAELSPDRNNSCMIVLEDGSEVQIEPDKEQETLIIGMVIGEVAPGPGREKFLEGALIANNRPYPRYGDFAYSRKLNHLIIHERLPIAELSGKVIRDHLMGLVEQGRTWREAIKRGLPPIQPIVAP